MKKIFLAFLLIVFTACGSDAQQTGLGGSNMIPVHGHNSSTDGGTLNAPSMRAYLWGSNPTVTSGAWTKIALNTVLYDSNSWYDNVTNYRYTPLQSGKYLVIANIYATASTSISVACAGIAKNGVVDVSVCGPAYSTSSGSQTITHILNMNGTTDYIDARINITGVGTISLIAGQSCSLSIIRISN